MSSEAHPGRAERIEKTACYGLRALSGESPPDTIRLAMNEFWLAFPGGRGAPAGAEDAVTVIGKLMGQRGAEYAARVTALGTGDRERLRAAFEAR